MKRVVHIISCLLLLVCFAADTARRATPLELSYPAYFGNRVFLPAENPATLEGVQLGRMLFYEKALSANGKISCGTCHQQAKAFTDGLTFSKGVDGTLQPRNTMSLVNLLWTRHFFWDGRAEGLEQQAVTPLTNLHEMGQSLKVSAQLLQQKALYPPLFQNAFGSDTITADRIVKALAQFERTLISANARYDQYLRGEYKPTPAELNGIALFYGNPDPSRHIRGAGCSHCHGGPKTYSELYHNNGLDTLPKDGGREQITGQAYDRGRFRVVSLRNIALTAPYMHDGRFTTLQQVVDHYSEHVAASSTLSPFLQNNSNTLQGIQLELTAPEKQDLLAFLHMLTDSSFITDNRFSDPFINQ